MTLGSPLTVAGAATASTGIAPKAVLKQESPLTVFPFNPKTKGTIAVEHAPRATVASTATTRAAPGDDAIDEKWR